MILQPRIASFAVAIAAALAGCSDDNPPTITGENTLVSGPSFPVLNSEGSDLTAVNQINFPLPGQLPLTSSGVVGNALAVDNVASEVEPNIGAASEAEIEPESGTANEILSEAEEGPDSGITSEVSSEAEVEPDSGIASEVSSEAEVGPDSGIASEVSSEAEVEPDSGITPEVSLDPDGDFYQPETALALSDPLGVQMGSLLESIGGLVIGEYELASGAVVFSDGTLEISKRLAQGCDSGEIESSLNLNGTSITDGSIEFSQCERAGSVITGLVSFATTNVGSVEVLEVNFNPVVAELSTGEVTLTGLINLEFVGDEVVLTSDNLSMIDSTTSLRWDDVAVTGRVAEDGERSLSGATTLVNNTATSAINFTFADVVVPGNDDFPASGVQSQEHTDGSRVDISYGVNGLGTFNLDITGSNGSNASFVSNNEEVDTEVPF